MSKESEIKPKLLGEMSVKAVIRALQNDGPASRADLTRTLGNSAPTVSKAVSSLLGVNLIEEYEAESKSRGRPANKLRLARSGVQVLGLVIDSPECELSVAGFDGDIRSEETVTFATPQTYDELTQEVCKRAAELGNDDTETLGMGISIPGLFDVNLGQSLLSPNVPITNGKRPGVELGERLGIPCVAQQEMDGLCLGERGYGAARGIDDFAILDVGAGCGLGLVTGGNLVTGVSGMAGEIGHIPIDPNGKPCGCGGTGCLETIASETALAGLVSESLEKSVSVDECFRLMESGEYQPDSEIASLRDGLAVGLATIINILNPAYLFVHSRLFDARDGLFDELVEATRSKTLAPSFNGCKIVQTRASKGQGAVAIIIEHITETLVAQWIHEKETSG